MLCFQTILDSCPVFTCLTPSSLDLARKGINQDLGSQHNTSRLQNPLQESLRFKPLLSRKIWSCSQSKTSWRNHEEEVWKGKHDSFHLWPRWAIDWLQCYNHPARGNKTAGQLLKSEVVSSIWIRSRRTRPELLNSVSRDANPHKVPSKVPGELGGCLRPNRIFNIYLDIISLQSCPDCHATHTFTYTLFYNVLQLPRLQWPWRCG